jgi:hypothetical protein
MTRDEMRALVAMIVDEMQARGMVAALEESTPADERPMGPIEVRAENCYFR